MIGVNIGIPVPREPFSFGGLYGTKSKCAAASTLVDLLDLELSCRNLAPLHYIFMWCRTIRIARA